MRLYALLARKAPIGVIFRRGPTKQVQLIRWDTAADTFQPGQWFKGRIYERRCDLSPYGNRLIYFAANYHEPFYSWTAVSRPPYLTALALWPKGDCWGGGGLFERENAILLNHFPDDMKKVAEGFHLPKRVRVEPLGDYSGRGEDDPIWETRLQRDGWEFVQQGDFREIGNCKGWIANPPEVIRRRRPVAECHWYLYHKTVAIAMNKRPWYSIEYHLANEYTDAIVEFGQLDWAEWDHRGDLVYAADGKIYRLGIADSDSIPHPDAATCIYDAGDAVFTAIESPASARKWFDSDD